MLEILSNIMADNQRMNKYKTDPLKHTFFLGLYDYVKQGNLLSDLSWFKGVDFDKWEKNPESKAKKAA